MKQSASFYDQPLQRYELFPVIVVRHLGFYRASSALAVYAMVVCLSVCLSVCLCVCVCATQVGVLLKWLNVGTRKQRHMIAQGL